MRIRMGFDEETSVRRRGGRARRRARPSPQLRPSPHPRVAPTKTARLKKLEEESIRLQQREHDLRQREETIETEMRKRLLEREKLICEQADKRALDKALIQVREKELRLEKEQERLRDDHRKTIMELQQQLITSESEPVEEAVGVVKNLRKLKSVSRTGQSDVVLEFAWGTDMDQASLDVRDKLDVLRLPLESKAPVLLRFNPSTEPVMRLVLTTPDKLSGSEQAELMRLRRYADNELKKKLEPVDGVAAVKVAGGLEDEVQVLVDADKLAQLNLPPGLVIDRLRQENINISGGRIEEGTQRYLVRTINQFADIDEMRELLDGVRQLSEDQRECPAGPRCAVRSQQVLTIDRARVIAAWETGEWTWVELAEQFEIGVATVNRLVARYRRTGSVERSAQNVPRGHSRGNQ